jgi:hypothetical protein
VDGLNSSGEEKVIGAKERGGDEETNMKHT